MIIADLHIHSRFSRATARNLDPEHLWLWAQLKGLDLVGTGDCTHPEWLAELKEKLVPDGRGAYALAPELCRALQDEVPPACRREVRFLLSGEISSIYKRHDKTRKVHNLVIMPDFAAVERMNTVLDSLGNITSDGRPILGLDSRDLLEISLTACAETIFIPAHIWTPWFSLFGSKSGFDRIEECYGDLTGHIHALETGLSSDPPMNWRVSALDRFLLVSNSDAHSPSKLAREANIFDCAPDFASLAALLREKRPGSAATCEFFPDEGKYHLDGHRKCGVRLSPDETRELGGFCPVCGGKLTVGVLSRVEDLADRPPGYTPPQSQGFQSLVPLSEVVGEAMGRGPATKGVRQVVEVLFRELGPELFVLRQAGLGDIKCVAGDLVAEAVDRMRRGKVVLNGGFDGQFGTVGLFAPGEREKLAGQGGFWGMAGAPKKKSQKPQPAKKPVPAEQTENNQEINSRAQGLDPGQRKMVEHGPGHLIVKAGPGSGKTRALIARCLRLLENHADPRGILLITFTRKAAGEMAERLAEAGGESGRITVSTFHGLGLQIISRHLGKEPKLLAEEAKLAMLKPLARQRELKPGDLAAMISRMKQQAAPPADSQEQGLLDAYQAVLEQAGFLDLDDLVARARELLATDADLAAYWAGRFSHILVDEYQDVNPVQTEFLKLLAGEKTRVTAIGDPDQAIYGFRGAERELFERFPQDFPGAARGGLSMNYRSQPRVVQAANQVLSNHGPGALCVREPGPPPVLCARPNPQWEARWIAAKIVGLMGGLDSRQVERAPGRDRGYAACDIAVLYRLHAQAGPIAQALAEAGIPVQIAAQEPLAETEPLDFTAQRVSLLTLHAAKGLEFPVVFIAGLEQGLLPYEPPGKEPADPEEERRLLYVGMTRAKDLLFLSRAAKRTLYGKTREPGLCPFLAQAPPGLWQEEKSEKKIRKARQMSLFLI